MLECFTKRGRRAITSAHDEARQLGAPVVGVEHLLLAVLQVDDGAMGHDVLGVSAAQVREVLTPSIGGDSGEPAASVPYASTAKQVMFAAVREFFDPDQLVGTTHLLACILSADDEATDRVMAALSVNRDEACRRARDLVSGA